MHRILPFYITVFLLVRMDVACGQTIPDSIAGNGRWTVDISFDDRYIATGGDDSLLQIFHYDLKLHRSIKYLDKGAIRNLRWHPKRNLLAIASMRSAWLLDPETGTQFPLEGVTMGSRAIAWNRDGTLLGMADGIGTVLIWNAEGKLLRRIEKWTDGQRDKKSFLGFDWHPDSQTLVTVGDEIRVYDTSGRELNSFRHRKQMAGLLSVKWHPSGNFFVTGDYGHENEGIPTLLQFWKPDGTLIREIRDSRKEYRSLQWNPGGPCWLPPAKRYASAMPKGNC